MVTFGFSSVGSSCPWEWESRNSWLVSMTPRTELSLLEEPSQPLQHLQLRQLVSTKIIQKMLFQVGRQKAMGEERGRGRESLMDGDGGSQHTKDEWEFLITGNNMSISSCFSPRCSSGWEIPWTKDPSFYIPIFFFFFLMHTSPFICMPEGFCYLLSHPLYPLFHNGKQPEACHSQIWTQFSCSWAWHNDSHQHQLSSRNWIKVDIFLKPPSSQAVPWEAPSAQPPPVLIRSSEEHRSAYYTFTLLGPDSTGHCWHFRQRYRCVSRVPRAPSGGTKIHNCPRKRQWSPQLLLHPLQL